MISAGPPCLTDRKLRLADFLGDPDLPDPFVEGDWPLPTVKIAKDGIQGAAYYPHADEVVLRLPTSTSDYAVAVLGHEMTHWAALQSVGVEEPPIWFEAITSDSSIFHKALQALELMALWSCDIPIPEHLLQLAERRRQVRLIKHKHGMGYSWRIVHRLEPMNDEERDLCRQLDALDGGGRR